jgi:hypothetical protein
VGDEARLGEGWSSVRSEARKAFVFGLSLIAADGVAHVSARQARCLQLGFLIPCWATFPLGGGLENRLHKEPVPRRRLSATL